MQTCVSCSWCVMGLHDPLAAIFSLSVPAREVSHTESATFLAATRTISASPQVEPPARRMPTAAPTTAAHRHDAHPVGLTPEAPHLACEATPAQQSWALRDGQQHQVAVALEILHTAHVRCQAKPCCCLGVVCFTPQGKGIRATSEKYTRQ